MDRLSVKKIKIEDYRIEVHFDCVGKWERYIQERTFFCEYNKKIETVPPSIAVIPFLGNILPVAWLHSLEIVADSLDKTFYECLPKVIGGYDNMYPALQFTNYLSVQNVVFNNRTEKDKVASFFSGGVDAYYTLLRHKDEISALATVWGSDITLDDNVGWDNVKQMLIKASKKYKKDSYIIKSNFREVINAKTLTEDLQHPGWSWWHEFQHGMGLITLLAPVAYSEKLSRIYIASSYTAEVKNLTCASDPSIDNFVRFNSCEVVHDGFESNRQDKVHYIVDYSRKNKDEIDLRVCWVTRGGRNCCKCEKCCRTMMAILLEDGELDKFGFKGDDATSGKISKNMKYRNKALPRDWDILHDKIKQKYTIETVPGEWKWFYRGGTASINYNAVFEIRNGCKWFALKLSGLKRRYRKFVRREK